MTGKIFVCAVRGAFKTSPGLAFAFLNAAHQLIHLALHELQIVTRQPRNGLFQFALDDVPVSFGNQCAHVLASFGGRMIKRARISFASNVPTR